MAGVTWSCRASKPDPDNDTFDIWVFFDPAYQDPLLLATNVALKPESVFALYLDRLSRWNRCPWLLRTDDRSASPVRLCTRKLSTPVRTGTAGRKYPHLSRRRAAADAHWFLGSTPKKTPDAAQGLGSHRFSHFP